MAQFGVDKWQKFHKNTQLAWEWVLQKRNETRQEWQCLNEKKGSGHVLEFRHCISCFVFICSTHSYMHSEVCSAN